MSISLAKKKDFNEIIKFIKENYVTDHILATNKKLFDDFYKNNKNYNILLYKDGVTISSILGFVNYSKYSKKNKDQITWLALWISKKNTFASGFKLIKHLEKKFKNNNIIGLGLTDTAVKLLSLIGYKIKILNHYYILNENFKTYKIIISPKKNKYRKKNLNFLFKKLTISDFKKINIPNRNNYKNSKYYINKYYKNKFYSYDFYYIQKKNNSDYLILITRKISLKKTNVLRIIEIIGQINTLKYSYYAIQNLLHLNKAEYIDCLNYGISKDIFISSGFNDVQNGTIVPNYFEPFKPKLKKIYFAYKDNKYIEKKLNIFKGDADQERPNIL